MATSTDVGPRPEEARKGGRLRSWLLEGLTDMAKRQPGPHAQPSSWLSACRGSRPAWRSCHMSRATAVTRRSGPPCGSGTPGSC
ncbi:hypothetical protein BJY27_004906 [Streptomyces rapamycinicus]|uniref:Amino acid transporter n=2 Tax=Streptomyces rapamycinicus TaxID=1226757 RepID=A0A3L8RLU4_STRRN|nr:hypothetical protein [Streptomyces rapamycinicus]RLV80567.1 amino acid transporter [Streptomyces rapamycinicus NRRL 5491]